jgi:hypothetical protein
VKEETTMKIGFAKFKIFGRHFQIASVFYSDSAVFTDKGTIDDVRRVNSCQMLFDGRRW